MEMFLTIELCTYAGLSLFSMERIIYIKMDLALDNLQRLICHKTKQINIYACNDRRSFNPVDIQIAYSLYLYKPLIKNGRSYAL